MAGEEREIREIPRRMWYEIFDRFTRRDELLVEILKDIRALLKKLEVPVPPEVRVPPIRVAVPPVEIPEVRIEWEIIDHLARRLEQLPNRLDKVEIDTSETSWRSLRSEGKLKGDVLLGFYIEDVGGGFTYKVTRGEWESPEKTACIDDRLDIEFDDLSVAGEGVEGTGVIWYFWREVTRPRLRRRR